MFSMVAFYGRPARSTHIPARVGVPRRCRHTARSAMQLITPIAKKPARSAESQAAIASAAIQPSSSSRNSVAAWTMIWSRPSPSRARLSCSPAIPGCTYPKTSEGVRAHIATAFCRSRAGGGLFGRAGRSPRNTAAPNSHGLSAAKPGKATVSGRSSKTWRWCAPPTKRNTVEHDAKVEFAAEWPKMLRNMIERYIALSPPELELSICEVLPPFRISTGTAMKSSPGTAASRTANLSSLRWRH